jgi:hypothetical protein
MPNLAPSWRPWKHYFTLCILNEMFLLCNDSAHISVHIRFILDPLIVQSDGSTPLIPNPDIVKYRERVP